MMIGNSRIIIVIFYEELRMNMRSLSLSSLLFVAGVVNCEEQPFFSATEASEVISFYDMVDVSTKTKEFLALESAIQRSTECFQKFEVILKNCREEGCDGSVEFKQAFEKAMESERAVNKVLSDIDKTNDQASSFALRSLIHKLYTDKNN
jgi:hypothetical protein